MLSKSQARLFFLVATGGFSLVFLGLTLDSLRQVPARSHADRLTPEVLRGREIWDANNCMGCHTILGEGAYYAPELTKVVERRGAPWLEVFLKDPEAMFPGERRMVNYHFDDQQAKDVVAFLTWIGEIDTNGFPAKPDLAPPAPVVTTAAATAPRPEVFGQICVACHALGGTGGAVGPALDGVANRYTPERLDAWLANPPAVKPGTAMPKLPLTDPQRQELVSWLMTLR